MNQQFLLLVICVVIQANLIQNNLENDSIFRPVVLMHGIFSCASALNETLSWIVQDFPGIYVNNVEIGDGFFDSVFMDINEQVDSFAQTVASDPKLRNGFNLLCHSQGCLVSRAFIERYNYPPVHNFISWAGPHQGVYGVPYFNELCPDDICPWLNFVVDLLEEGEWVDTEFQRTISFAAYWKDPFEYSTYIISNIFLADINNEREDKNITYKKNMESLNSVLLLYSEIDDIVIPNHSPWFWFYANNSDSVLVPFNQSATYEDDFIGLQTLYKEGKIEFVGVPCGHTQIPNQPCRAYYDLYTRPYLNNTLPIRKPQFNLVNIL